MENQKLVIQDGQTPVTVTEEGKEPIPTHSENDEENNNVVKVENENPPQQTTEQQGEQKKSYAWIGWLVLAIILAGLLAWIIYNAVNDLSNGTEVKKFYNIPSLLGGIFIVVTLGYLLGRITIKGVSLGTAGVFIVAILFGVACYFIPEDLEVLGVFNLKVDSKNNKYYAEVIQNVGLVFFVGSVGFIAGPKFFKDLAKNFKTYIEIGRAHV